MAEQEKNYLDLESTAAQVKKSIEEIVEICKAENINGVIPTTELTILPAAQISERLGLLGNEISVAKDITNKYITREKVKSVLGL